AVTYGTVTIEKIGLNDGREIDDADIDLGGRVDAQLFFNQEPLAALIDLALVVVEPQRREIEELLGILPIGNATQLSVRSCISQGGGVDAIVVARVELPDVA